MYLQGKTTQIVYFKSETSCPDTYKLPTKKPRILPGEELNEKSKKVLCCIHTHLLNFLLLVPQHFDRMHEKDLLQFKRKVRSVVIDGTDIMAAATEACRRSLAIAEAKEAAAKAAAKKEEERVSVLKKARGEKWLPSVAKYMQVSLLTLLCLTMTPQDIR